MKDYLQFALARGISSLLYYSPLLDSQIRSAIRNGAQPWRIIHYRRIVNPEDQAYPLDPNGFVRPKTFEKQMLYLAKQCRLISLNDLIERIDNQKPILDKTVIVTFDGGYRDNYDNAFPILQNHKIPCTIFLPTAFIGTMNQFWTDKVIACMLLLEKSGVNFPKLPFLEQQPRDNGEDIAYSMTRILHLIDYLKKAPLEERSMCLQALGIGIDSIGGMPVDRTFLSWEEVREMANAGITFASNSHSHKKTLEYFENEFEADLLESLDTFKNEEVLPLNVYSYPDGELSKESRLVLYKHGIKHCVSLGYYPLPKEIKKSCIVLGRVSINESLSYAVDVFACRLWGASLFGQTY
jgi:peptidoglycan/xylan/chitin deacetylase (PgdA/CDA1 family)